MNRTCKFVNGKAVWEPPFTKEEERANKERFAEMCQSRQGPMLKGTDSLQFQGKVRDHGIGHLPDFMQTNIVNKAKYFGIDITGKVYRTDLADKRGAGDPGAWVGDNHDILEACKRKGRSCSGHINYEAPEPDPTPDVPLAPRIINQLAAKYVAENPKLAKDPVELREMVIHNHGAPAHGRDLKNRIAKNKKLDSIPAPSDPD